MHHIYSTDSLRVWSYTVIVKNAYKTVLAQVVMKPSIVIDAFHLLLIVGFFFIEENQQSKMKLFLKETTICLHRLRYIRSC